MDLSKLRGFSAPQGTPVYRKTWGEPLFPDVFPSGRLHSSHRPQQHPLESHPVEEVIKDYVTVTCVYDIVVHALVDDKLMTKNMKHNLSPNACMFSQFCPDD